MVVTALRSGKWNLLVDPLHHLGEARLCLDVPGGQGGLSGRHQGDKSVQQTSSASPKSFKAAEECLCNTSRGGDQMCQEEGLDLPGEEKDWRNY